MAGPHRSYHARGRRLTLMTLIAQPDLPARLRPALPFAIVGTACVIAGGLVAAATAPAPSEHGSWAAAYLVLVAGMAQVALAMEQGMLAQAPLRGARSGSSSERGTPATPPYWRAR